MLPMSFSASTSTSSKSGDAQQNSGYSANGFNVNFGSGVSQGGASLPTWMYIAAAVAVLLILKKRKK